ncbi:MULTISPECIES: dUTP diphosphatase [Rossellomorea]|uniref:dUTP diphosphatase n=1 Tax=Rossellomorea TaxID=2837508 RepID=UPI0006F67A11|nr:dUTP diphosphatase [Rossellomorea marisflavi]KQU59362.1 dUTPase [Bacillus sp. Leaf406]UKS64264.1 dUTP diphosphatase [Rossellomorea marisflavi]
MDWNQLLNMQNELDRHIESEHGLQDADLVDKKILALLVELGELANETRCFKFWSKKAPSEQEVILEEYVDGIHFILSLGIDIGIRSIDEPEVLEEGDPTEEFLKVYSEVNRFSEERSIENLLALFQQFLQLGRVLGFKSEDIFKSYLKKNEVNYQRQQEGY